MLFLLLLSFAQSSGAAVGRNDQAAIAIRDIQEYETLSEDNLVTDEGYEKYRGCISRVFVRRGSMLRPEDVSCLGPTATASF